MGSAGRCGRGQMGAVVMTVEEAARTALSP